MLNPWRTVLLIAVAVCGLSVCSFAQNPANWSYGAFNGPARWAALFPVSCAKPTGQSPISIPAHLSPTALPHIKFQYQSAHFLVENINYATEVLATNSAENRIIWNNVAYNLVQIHFHFPAEHQIAGVTSPVTEAHFVHKDGKGNLLVIAVLAINGGANGTVTSIWNNLPPSYGGHGEVSINPLSLLPGNGSGADNLGYYTYQGSLTVPLCDQPVTWLVLKRQMDISQAQLDKAKCNTYPNARPLQNQTPSPVIKESDF